jgi:hypothetical protein
MALIKRLEFDTQDVNPNLESSVLAMLHKVQSLYTSEASQEDRIYFEDRENSRYALPTLKDFLFGLTNIRLGDLVIEGNSEVLLGLIVNTNLHVDMSGVRKVLLDYERGLLSHATRLIDDPGGRYPASESMNDLQEPAMGLTLLLQSVEKDYSES